MSASRDDMIRRALAGLDSDAKSELCRHLLRNGYGPSAAMEYSWDEYSRQHTEHHTVCALVISHDVDISDPETSFRRALRASMGTSTSDIRMEPLTPAQAREMADDGRRVEGRILLDIADGTEFSIGDYSESRFEP